ncbi:MAG: hypothetical protein ACFB9M_14035 [Myxococcota bacterium]
MRRGLGVLITALVTGTTSSAGADAPETYIPERAEVVAVFEHPAKTLSRVESFAIQSGLAPAGAAPGYLRAELIRQQPWMARLDLDAPIWFGIWSAAEQAVGVLVAELKEGQTVEGLESLLPQVRASSTGRRLVLRTPVLPATYAQPSRRHFTFRSRSSKAVADKARVLVHVKIAALRRWADIADQASGDVQLDPDDFEDFEAVTLGASLEAENLYIRLGTEVKPSTLSAEALAMAVNRSAPLIRGLPRNDYVVVLGSAQSGVSSDRLGSLLESMGARAAGALASEDHPPKEWVSLVMRGMTELWSGTKRTSVGLAMTGTSHRPTLHMVSEGNAERLMSRVPRFQALVQEGLAGAADAEKSGERLRLRSVRQTRASTDFLGFALAFDAPPSSDPKVVRLLQEPLLFGAVSETKTVTLWNVSDSELDPLLDAARKGKALTLPSLTRVSAQLPEQRTSETFVDTGQVGVFLAGLLSPALARTLAPGFRDIPPIGLTSTKLGPRDMQWDMSFPTSAAQIAASLGALARP